MGDGNKSAQLGETEDGTFSARELLWPDPDIRIPHDKPVTSTHREPSELRADNISGLQATRVSGFFYPQNVNDIREVVRRAKQYHKKICMRGTAHCMSKANVAEDGLVIDFSFMKKVQVINDGDMVICEPGAQWRDLINALNPYGRSPKTMQSYSTFATGGSLSCNAHGITSDDCCADGVVEASIMTSDGVVHQCRQDAPHDSREKILLKHVFGGFGLFGIICSLTLKTLPNYSILADTIVCNINEFPSLYESILADNGRGQTVDEGDNTAPICVKLARFNIISCQTVQIFLFRRRGYVPSVSQLTKSNTSAPRRMGYVSQLLYKWVMPALLDVRFQVEEQTASAMDWSDSFTCNELLFESAEPLARMVEPLFQTDDTFILQEYFVPVDKVLQWIQLAKPIFKDVANNSSPEEGTRVILLNTTIRVVNADTITALPYSPQKTFAFVLYYRLCRNEASVNYLRTFCQRFIDVTLQCEGRFYLPYLHHYSTEQLLESYPEWPAFIETKEMLDPDGLFDSGWFREYGLQFTSESYRALFIGTQEERFVNIHEPVSSPRPQEEEISEDICELIKSVSTRRRNSLRKMMNCVRTRSAFFSEFMVNVFNIADEHRVESILSRCCWDPRLKTDDEIYPEFKRMIEESVNGNLAKVKKGWMQLKQLSNQKAEFTDEILKIMTRLGKLGHIHDICTIGDRGKLVRSLQRRLNIRGKVYVIHEEPVAEDDVVAAVETSSISPVGDMFECTFNAAGCKFPFIPDQSSDLVTMMQGMHHLDPKYLTNFLREVERILRPGGIFLVREHDVDVTGLPIIDAAHIVFNALTGVSYRDERDEIRAFRSLDDWRKILKHCTALEHAMLFEVQDEDPTFDVMMCFFKPPLHPRTAAALSTTRHMISPQRGVSFPRLPFQTTLETLPNTLLHAGRKFLNSIVPALDTMVDTLAPIIAPSPAMVPTARGMLRSYTDVFAKSIVKLVEQTHYVQPRTLKIEAIPSEMFYGFLALKSKVSKGNASMQESMAVNTVMKVVNALFGADSEIAASSPETSASMPSPIDSIATQLKRLLQSHPTLVDHEYLISHGFPEPVVDALLNALPPSLVTLHHDSSTSSSSVVVDDNLVHLAATKLQTKIDAESWLNMSRYIDTIISEQSELTFDLMLGRHCKKYDDAVSPWFFLLTSFLGSSRFSLSTGATLLARWYGVPELGALFKHAQMARKSGRQAAESKDVLGLTESMHAQLDEAIASITSPVRHVTIRQGDFRNIHHVREVIHAEYSGKDVTATVRKKLLRTSVLPTGEKTSTVLLETDRNLDSVFSYGLTPLSCYFYGERSFTLTYTSDEPVPVSSMAEGGLNVKRVLERSNNPTIRMIGQGRKTASSVLFNCFKVLEYLQVEILKDFSAGLNKTPWYRFDMLGTMKTYFKVMFDAVETTASEFGYEQTLTSAGFMTALVPGVVMSFILAQVQLLAMPVLWSLGDTYDTNNMKSRWLVHLSLSNEEMEFNWPVSFTTRQDVRITPLHSNSMVLIETPVFIEFSQLLIELSRHESNGKVTILDIDGNDRIAMKIHRHLQEDGNNAPSMCDLLKTNGISSLHEISTWNLCNDSLPETRPREKLLYSAITIHVSELLVAISACDQVDVAIDQIFDFYG